MAAPTLATRTKPNTVSVTMGDEWDWEFIDSARRHDPWEWLEPSPGVPHQKLRVGPFRLGCRADRNENVLYVLSIRKRGGDAYRGDDD